MKKLIISLLLSIPICVYSSAMEWSTYSLVNRCNVFDSAGLKVKSFPGEICVFLPDHSIISATTRKMVRINKDQKIIWEINGYFHHQLTLSPDKKRLLALSAEIIKSGSEDVRVDKFMVVSIDGKVLHERLASEFVKIDDKQFWKISEKLDAEVKARKELTHFNSINEIPGDLPVKASFMKAGTIIVNSVHYGSYFLSPDLKLIHHMQFKNSRDHLVHDVQASRHGNLIYFNNLMVSSSEDARASSIDEIEPVDQKIVFTIQASPAPMFFSRVGGSFQELDDNNVLFTHALSGTYLYSKEKKSIVRSFIETHTDLNGIRVSLQVKAIKSSMINQ